MIFLPAAEFLKAFGVIEDVSGDDSKMAFVVAMVAWEVGDDGCEVAFVPTPVAETLVPDGCAVVLVPLFVSYGVAGGSCGMATGVDDLNKASMKRR